MKRGHRGKLLQHLGQQFLHMPVHLLLVGWQLLHLTLREEYEFKVLQDQILIIVHQIKALEEVKPLVTPEKVSDCLERRLRKLYRKKLPVSVLNLQKSRQIICLMLHQSYEASIELLVAIYFVLELTLLILEKLIFVHRQG